MSILEQVEAARLGREPALICQVRSGWVVLCKMQFLRGYCILMPDPLVKSINALDAQRRSEFMHDMTIVGDALQEVTGSYRVNYAIMGNSDQVLHAHIVPRYLDEPDLLRQGLPWLYPQTLMDEMLFDYDRDIELMGQIKMSIEKHSAL